MNRIAVKIKEARLKAKLSEKDLAKKCGLTASYIMQVELGKKVINEKVAESILSALGEKLDVLNMEPSKEEEREVPKKRFEPKQKEEFYEVKPTDSWLDSLASLIKKYPIYDVHTNKVVGEKELPVIGKKVEGYVWDKLIFVQASDSSMESHRIKKNDVVMVNLTNEIQNNSLYLFEMDNKKSLRILRKENNNRVIISTGLNSGDAITVDAKKIKVIGKCVRVEFSLDKK